ncbi:putative hydrolase YugF-like isoform X2 [Cucumis melo var. makuwa]|uniref:Hydrolase YugF-like isoform X2 n=2 Tax=Cucumis melo var. makuwa TaxID=1194695 RepID=A0A5A7VJK0_CUCMM|nr:putative hydrolase YugF-like isoform X2 [Cucumis melo var. makuwa]
MSSCVKPAKRSEKNPVVLLHCFDSSCLEWSYAFPLLEEAGLETWAVDVLGWGFSDLDSLPPCNVETKRSHLYQFWKTYIKRPMVLVGPSLGAAIAVDFAVNHPEAEIKVKTRKVIVAMDLECLKVRHLCEDVGHVGPKTCLDVKNSFVEVSHVSHKACLLLLSFAAMHNASSAYNEYVAI